MLFDLKGLMLIHKVSIGSNLNCGAKIFHVEMPMCQNSGGWFLSYRISVAPEEFLNWGNR